MNSDLFEHAGEIRVILLRTVQTDIALNLVRFFLDHSVYTKTRKTKHWNFARSKKINRWATNAAKRLTLDIAQLLKQSHYTVTFEAYSASEQCANIVAHNHCWTFQTAYNKFQ